MQFLLQAASPETFGYILLLTINGLLVFYECTDQNPEGKRPFGRYRRRWEGDIKMDFSEIRWEGVDWIHLARERDQWRTGEHGNELSGSIKGWEFLD
jgi:hypothetical protein